MKKVKIIAFILSLVMLASVLVACGGGATVETVSYTADNGVVYTLTKTIEGSTTTTSVKVTGYTGPQHNPKPPYGNVTVEISAQVTIDGVEYPVEAIGATAFNQIDVTKIVVPEGVKAIEAFAFGYCGAGEIVLPSTITSIGDYAFINSLSLKIVRIAAVTPPTLGGNYVFKCYIEGDNVYVPHQELSIRVPEGQAGTYANAWAEYASLIK